MILNQKLLLTFVKAFCFVILLNSCRHDPIGYEGLPKICFNKEILPIFTSNCTMCHGSLSSADGILSRISPYKPQNSELYKAVTNSWSIMPPTPHNPLSKDQRTKLYLWILQGAETSCK